eukprot:3657579-Pyramimonas_sp.AAC.1
MHTSRQVAPRRQTGVPLVGRREPIAQAGVLIFARLRDVRSMRRSRHTAGALPRAVQDGARPRFCRGE